MRWPATRQLLVSILLIQTAFAFGVRSFSWIRRDDRASSDLSKRWGGSHTSSSAIVNSQAKSADMYSLAIDELQAMELEPLCHRVAARLLVHHCQVLDGQDEATVLTDTGRAARDFVDAYAASLAICDLERGSFSIPSVCSKFREPTLSRIPPPTTPQLHATSTEIDGCLEGLARSDAAWNTWLSYRHKALRFCEAARAENEKDQTIQVYQAVTSIMRRLTTQIEKDLERRFEWLEEKFQQTHESLQGLAPHVKTMQSDLEDLKELVSDGIMSPVQILETLLRTVSTNTDNLVVSHQSAVQSTTDQINQQAGAMMTAIQAVMLTASSLQHDIDISKTQAIELGKQQDRLEEKMVRLAGLADSLTLKQDQHQTSLDKARLMTDEVLRTLNTISESASTFGSSFRQAFSWSGWWPYIYCPAATLFLGSYGLQPSAARNFILVSIGELVGYFVSSASSSFTQLLPQLTNTNFQVTYANSSGILAIKDMIPAVGEDI
ncbi:hypothetical protein B0I35DRAFT_488002 [Stachybotrys elegans]|uniref:Nuclear fusion protein KAR5 n=1 Tax=Stachybotrys elegans TaxID=80388 RepID=A0A8K0SQN1_9HYPO|nr:hypothetical protein B0I35DRAFT_488002 [Stachybotrys elegans]